MATPGTALFGSSGTPAPAVAIARPRRRTTAAATAAVTDSTVRPTPAVRHPDGSVVDATNANFQSGVGAPLLPPVAVPPPSLPAPGATTTLTTPAADLTMAVIGGVFVGAVAHTRLSTDLSVAAGALAAGLIVQCQRSAGALEMREFISFAANMAVEQGGRYGMFIIFLIFLIRGIAGTPASSSGASGHLDIVLDAGAPPPPPSRSRSRSRSRSPAPGTPTRLLTHSVG